MKSILLGAFMLLFFYVPTQADHARLPELSEPFRWQDVPVVCGPHQAILDKVQIQHGLKLVEISFGKRGAQSNGDVVFAIMQFVGDNNERAVIMSLPNDPMACVLYISFDAQGTQQNF